MCIRDRTTDPDNPVLNLAAAQDYDAFFEQEIAYRKLGLYPPFCGLCVVGLSLIHISFSAFMAL